jgi:hypothetical protein
MEIMKHVPKGALAFTLMDQRSSFVIWIGTAEADVLDKPTDDIVKARLDYAVTQLIKRIPK